MCSVGRPETAGIPRYDPTSDVIFVAWNKLKFSDAWAWREESSMRFWSCPAFVSLAHVAIDWRFWVQEAQTDSISLVEFACIETLTIVVHGEDWGCEEKWKDEYTGDITLLNSTDPQCPFEVDLKLEVECELVRQKESGWAHDGWEVPEVFIKYMAREGKRCCAEKI